MAEQCHRRDLLPPMIVDSRNWLPPVMKMPSACSSSSSQSSRSQSSLTLNGRARADFTPTRRKTSSYLDPASSSSEAVGMIAMRALSPPHR